jgi:hypothetical protein
VERGQGAPHCWFDFNLSKYTPEQQAMQWQSSLSQGNPNNSKVDSISKAYYDFIVICNKIS